jgi:dTDP-4-dehydrorhamnose reductase
MRLVAAILYILSLWEMNMNIFIVGCHGLLGQKLLATAPLDYQIYGADVHNTSDQLKNDRYRFLDITNRKLTMESIMRVHPDWIINAAAYTNVDGAEHERDLCWRVNVTGVENLAHAAHRAGARLVHISTDYIFDGQNGPYREDDRPNPRGFYAKSKLAGENVLHNSLVHYIIIRTMVLYGYAVGVRLNFVVWLIGKLIKKEPVCIVMDQFGNTTLADELAVGIYKVIDKNFSGILHIAGREIIDRYSFALKIAQVFQLDCNLISPVSTSDLKQEAPRPLRSGLIVDRALQMGIELSNVEEGLIKLKNQYPDTGGDKA